MIHYVSLALTVLWVFSLAWGMFASFLGGERATEFWVGTTALAVSLIMVRYLWGG